MEGSELSEGADMKDTERIFTRYPTEAMLVTDYKPEICNF